MGCGRATEALGPTVNNYVDVRAEERRAALTAVTHTQGTDRRWRSVSSCFRVSLPTMNYGLSYEPIEIGGDVRAQASENDSADYATDHFSTNIWCRFRFLQVS